MIVYSSPAPHCKTDEQREREKERYRGVRDLLLPAPPTLFFTVEQAIERRRQWLSS